jgi:hypothetical protein
MRRESFCVVNGSLNGFITTRSNNNFKPKQITNQGNLLQYSREGVLILKSFCIKRNHLNSLSVVVSQSQFASRIEIVCWQTMRAVSTSSLCWMFTIPRQQLASRQLIDNGERLFFAAVSPSQQLSAGGGLHFQGLWHKCWQAIFLVARHVRRLFSLINCLKRER